MSEKIPELLLKDIIESREKIIVGVNKFVVDEKNTTPGFKIDDSIRTLQTNKLNSLKQRRDAPKVQACLSAIHQKATGTENLMPAVIDAVENCCTLGEIADELRKIFGEYK